jgi:hypothetical protein
MDRLSALMVRASFVWLLAGVVVGGLMLTDRAIPGDWRLWASPTHGHMLFVGWFVQFVLGIAIWLLPRRRTPARPLGYDERATIGAIIALNLGLVLRVIGEPAERAGYVGGWTLVTLAASAILQIGAIAAFVLMLWPRVGPRAARIRGQDAAATEPR